MHISIINLLFSTPLISLANLIDFEIDIEERTVEADNATASPNCGPQLSS
jgi:hypothetical protein